MFVFASDLGTLSCEESDALKIFANSQLSASNFKSFSRSLEHFFLTVGQNNFGNRIPILQVRIFSVPGIHLGCLLLLCLLSGTNLILFVEALGTTHIMLYLLTVKYLKRGN